MSTHASQTAGSDTGRASLATVRHFINGEFVASADGRTFDNVNPATGQVISQVARGGAEDIHRAAMAANRAYEEGPWARMPMAERCRRLRQIGERLLDRLEDFAQAETRDTGKPITESREGDIPRAALNFTFFAEYAGQLGEECYTVSPKERHFAVREPLGVAGLITPWNLPLYLATWKVAPALAMGNSVILKPAEWTPTTATMLAELFQELEMPPGVFNVVHGFGAGEAGEALTRHPAVRAISFTGETSTGKAIMAAAADSLKKVSFELGGKGANILFADADLADALPVAVRAAFRNQGQICLAGSRLFVERRILPEVTEELVRQVRALRVGDPMDPATQMGAIISAEQLDKVQRYIETGRAQGRLLTGGGRLALDGDLAGGFFLSPTVFADLPRESALCCEEIFGPVLPIIPFEDEEDVLGMVNGTPYGLSASVWSRDVNRCHRMAGAIRSGMVWVNCWFARDLRMPFGGMKASGIGREGGRYSLDFFSEAKAVAYRYQP